MGSASFVSSSAPEVSLINARSWLKKQLGSCASIKARIGWQGLTTKEYLNSGDYYLITGTDFLDGRIDWKNCHYVTKDRFDQDPHIKIQKGDVLVSKDGTIGKVAFLDNIPRPGTLNSGVFVIRSKDKQVSQRYLAKVFVSKYFDDFIDSIVAGSTIVHLYQKDIVNFSFFVPPTIEEQNRIADVLESIDNLLVRLDEAIAKKRQIKEGLMQQLLTGKNRIPGYDASIWKRVRLGDISKICTGKRNGDEQKESGLYPFFVRSQTVYRIDTYSYDGEAIIVPGEGGIGKIFHYINGKFDYHQRVYKISDFNDGIDVKFVYYYMKSFFGTYALMNTVKATVDSLRLPTFLDFIMTIPNSVEEQKQIAAILTNADNELLAMESKRDKYLLIKQGMMQELLTGKTRLI